MTTPTPCDRLAAYLDGQLALDEEAAFETHAATCETCLGAADAEVADALAHLGAVACPPDVLDAALAQAHRAAPDRVPARGRTLRSARVWAGIAAALALGLTALFWTVRDSDAPQIAGVEPVEAEAVPAPPPAPDDVTPAPEAPPQTAPPPRTTPTPAPPRSTTPPSPRRPAPRPATVPAPEAVAPLPEVAAADSVAIAREEVLLALAIVSDAQDHAALAVAHGVGRFSDALHSTPTLLSPQTP